MILIFFILRPLSGIILINVIQNLNLKNMRSRNLNVKIEENL